ncbi:MAG: hypothetical protein IKK51_04550 [Oscillospiraceae bacterium]|nr:hypothetical protein [Oscillospiraceae bacterium]
MRKRKLIYAILHFSVGLAFLIITIIFLLLGKIHNMSDWIFALIIALAGLLEGIIGYVEYKKKQ